MANAYLKNARFNSYAEVISGVVETLVSAGWTYQASGSGAGAGYNASGKVFTTTGSGSTGWANSGAWARIQDPSGGREFLFQHNNGGFWRIKYSAANKFTQGSPAAGVTPWATDERYIRGGGTDASPNYGTSDTNFADFGTANSFGSGGTISYFGAAMGTAPYGFWFCGTLLNSASQGQRHNRYMGLMMDPVTGAPEDVDPVVIHIAKGISGASNSNGPFEAYSVNSDRTGVFSRDGGLTTTWAWSNSTAALPYQQNGTFGHMMTPKSSTVTYSTTNIIAWVGHGLTRDCQVIFTNSGGALPTGLTAGVTYYVIATNLTNDQFSLSLARGGSTVSITAAGTGTHTAYANAFFYVQPAGFVTFHPGNTTFNTMIFANGSGLPLNPFNGKIDTLPMLYMRSGVAEYLGGIKGWSTMARWSCRPQMHAIDTSEDLDWICIGNVWLPWDGTTLPIG